MQLSDILGKFLFSLFFVACLLVVSLKSSPVAERNLIEVQPAAPPVSMSIGVPFLIRPRKPHNRSHRRHHKSIFSKIMAANEISKETRTNKAVNLFQGDIVMTQRMRKAIRRSMRSGSENIDFPPRQGGRRGKRAAIANELDRWPRIANGEVQVPYVIESSSAAAESVIKSAMSHWTSNVPCIKFVKKTNQQDYVSFFSGVGCYSQVGRIGGVQRISIGPGCEHMGIIAHEIGHSLGFWHEQSRPDRDQHVKILWKNIKAGKEDDFKKIIGGAIDSQGVPYDLDSLMHYGPTAFANAQGVNTIVKLDGSTNFGQLNGLSAKDIEQAKRMYCDNNNGCQYIDQNQHCPEWAYAGYCHNATWKTAMQTDCKRSCLCNVCEDRDVNCAAYTAGGYCTDATHQTWMAAYCKKSCNRCT